MPVGRKNQYAFYRVSQFGAQGLDLGLDLGVFFQAALEEPVDPQFGV